MKATANRNTSAPIPSQAEIAAALALVSAIGKRVMVRDFARKFDTSHSVADSIITKMSTCSYTAREILNVGYTSAARKVGLLSRRQHATFVRLPDGRISIEVTARRAA
jgi:hypothetical protein